MESLGHQTIFSQSTDQPSQEAQDFGRRCARPSSSGNETMPVARARARIS